MVLVEIDLSLFEVVVLNLESGICFIRTSGNRTCDKSQHCSSIRVEVGVAKLKLTPLSQ